MNNNPNLIFEINWYENILHNHECVATDDKGAGCCKECREELSKLKSQLNSGRCQSCFNA